MKKLNYFRFIFCYLLIAYSTISIGQVTLVFNYTGTVQEWVVPACVYNISIVAAGAEGGGINGGNGSVVSYNYAVTPGQLLQIYVGGSGDCPGAGYNGGGMGGIASTTVDYGCGGGGSTDIRVSPFGLNDRVLVAAGGGGMGGGTTDAVAGNGGCFNGIDGTSPFGFGGTGATLTTAGVGGPPWIPSGFFGENGALGVGGNGAPDPCFDVGPGGGGGGGYYGGGGGGSDCFAGAPYGGGSGGGGSSLTPSGGNCTDGTNNGPGYLTITYSGGVGNIVVSNTGPYCIGQTINLISSGINATATFSWVGPSNFTSTDANPTIPLSQLVNGGTYSLIVSDNGCSSTTTTNVQVDSIPNVNAGPDTSICEGFTLTLAGSGAITYSWNNNVIDNTPFTPPLGTSTYILTGSIGSCLNTDTIEVTVNSNPTPVINGTFSYCSGTVTSLNVNNLYDSYNWSNGDNTNSTSVTIADNPISVTVTNQFGCEGTSPNVTVTEILPTITYDTITICSGQSVMIHGTNESIAGLYTQQFNGANGCDSISNVLLIISPLPIIFAGNDVTVCIGGQCILTASGGISYNWDNGIQNGVVFTPSIGTTTYTVSGTDNLGCVNVDQVDVVALPSPVLSFNTDTTSGCIPLAVNFSCNNPNLVNCIWDLGDGTIINSCGPITNLYTTVNCFDVSFTATDNFGCTATVISDNLICTEAPPIASFNTHPSEINLFDTEVHFYNTSIGASSYLWDFGNVVGNNSSSNLTSPIYDYNNNPIGNYLVTLVAFSPSGCSDTTTNYVHIIEDLVYYVPNTFTPDDDLYNQQFKPIFTSGFDPFDYTLTIFNRWGDVIFESHNCEFGWDGSYGNNGLVQEGVYTWHIEFKKNNSDERKIITGHVNLIK